MIIELITKKKHIFVIKVEDETLDPMQAKAKAIDFLTDNGLEPVAWSTEDDRNSKFHDIDFAI